MGKVLGLTLVVVVIAVALAYLVGWIFDADLANFMNEKKGGWFMAPFILMLTTLGIGLSFWKPVKKLDKSYDLGMYLIYIFSLAIASMADLSNLKIMENLNMIAFLAFAIFVSLFIHAIICRLFRVDADSMVVVFVVDVVVGNPTIFVKVEDKTNIVGLIALSDHCTRSSLLIVYGIDTYGIAIAETRCISTSSNLADIAINIDSNSTLGCWCRYIEHRLIKNLRTTCKR